MNDGRTVDLDASGVADILKALSNPNRLRIFLLVRDASLNQHPNGLKVGEISEKLEISQSTVSHYLKELEHASLIDLKRRGKNVFCTPVCGPLADAVDFLTCARESLDS
jgi:ArsR family transcriptional regulator